MQTKALCMVKLDRTIFTGEGRQGGRIARIDGYNVIADFRPKPQGKIASYDRVRKFRSRSDDSQVVVQYRRLHPWCRPLRVTVIADDSTGIERPQFDAVLQPCLGHRSSTVELAFDFPVGSGVDSTFVRRHARFGKSRRRHDRGGEGQLRYGGRQSPKLVRCYWKPRLHCYRIELELHSALLRLIGVTDISEFGRLYGIVPSHFCFAAISFRRLERHLLRKFGEDGQVLLVETRLRAAKSLRLALSFLKRNGIANPHRFLHPLRLNDELKAALRSWLGRFCRAEDREIVRHP
jgi:hypothetical protein